MCESHRHSGAESDVAVMPRNVGRTPELREARPPRVTDDSPINLADERIPPAERIESAPEPSRPVAQLAQPVVKQKATPTPPQPAQSPSLEKPPVPTSRTVSTTEIENPMVDLSRANFGPMRKLTAPSRLGDSVKTESVKPKAAPPRPAVASAPLPQEMTPRRPQSYIQPDSPKAPEADLKKTITALLSTAISQQGNYSGTQKSQQPRILKWQDDLLNCIHQAIDGNRFKGADLRPGVARNASLEFIRSKVTEIAGKDATFPKFLQK